MKPASAAKADLFNAGLYGMAEAIPLQGLCPAHVFVVAMSENTGISPLRRKRLAVEMTVCWV